MTVRLNPYLSFRGNAREAMEFYHSVFGGNLDVSTFADAGGMGVPDDEQSNVMHAMLEVPGVLTLMGADTPSHMGYDGAGRHLGLPQRRRRRHVAAAGGTDSAPTARSTCRSRRRRGVTPSAWLTDKYGIDWLVNIAGPETAAEAQVQAVASRRTISVSRSGWWRG